MPVPLRAVPCLLFVSGLCALVYQTVWMRELRLVFGASTLAGAAVLAIFMAGLGTGALIRGRCGSTACSNAASHCPPR